MRYIVKTILPLSFLLLFYVGKLEVVSQNIPELIYYTFDAPGNQYNYASAPVGDNPATLVDLGVGGTGQFGTALFGTDLLGVGRFLDTDWIMDLPVTGWTISFWFNFISDLTDPTEVIFNDKAATVYSCYRGLGENAIRFMNWADGWEIILDNLPTGPFVIHYVYDGNELKAYINGVYKKTIIIGPTNFLALTPLAIGGWTGMENILGSTQIDEFRIYNRTLSDAEIALTWNKTLIVPQLTTLAATTVTTNGATLNANVNANESSSLIIFEYGTTTAYGSTAPGVPSPVTGNLDTPVSAILTGLIPNTLYHYRVVAPSSISVNGNDLTFDLVPLPGITGPNSICEGTENNVYTTESGKSNYVWAVSTGGTITAGGTTASNTVTVTWNTSGARQVSVNYENSNGIPAASPTAYPVTVNSLPVPTIYSPTLLSESFENGGAIPANWSLETISPNNTVSFVNASSSPAGYSAYDGNWFVRLDSYLVGGGVVRMKRTGPVSTLNYKTVDIDFAWFESSSYAAVNDQVEFEWSVDGINWISGGFFPRYNPVQGWKKKSLVLPSSASGQARLYIAFKFISDFGNDCYLDMVNINVGNTDVCVGKTISYQTESGMTSYYWTTTSGGTIKSGSGTNLIEVLWHTPGPGIVAVNYSDPNGCKATNPTIYPVNVNIGPVPVITGPNNVCLNTTSVYQTESNQSDYLWTVSAGGSINGSSTNSEISVTWDILGSGGSRWLSVSYTEPGGCRSATPSIYNVNVNPKPVPTLVGPTTICYQLAGNVYQTDVGMSNYTWTIKNGSISSGGTVNDNTVTITWDKVPGANHSVAVSYTNSSGCRPVSNTVLAVTVYSLPTPVTVGSIAGSSRVCVGDNNVSFWVVPVPNASSYDWQLPYGATISSGAGTANITVDFSNDAISGDIMVTGVNPCGTGPPSPKYLVRISKPLANAGPVTGNNVVCKNDNEVNYFISPIYDADNYNWVIPNGAVIVSGDNTPNIMVDFSNSSSGIISVFASNSCGAGVRSPDLLITVSPQPHTPVISLTGNTLSSNQPTGNQWFLNGNPIFGANSQNYQILSDGIYHNVITWFGCISGESNHIYVTIDGINEIKKQDFSIYPVPNDGSFTISLGFPEEDMFYIRVYNDLGLQVYEFRKILTNYLSELYIDLKPIPMGVYTIVVENDHKRITRKIVVIN